MNFKKIVVMFFCFFAFSSLVNAGVCDGKEISSGSYCKSDHGYIYKKEKRYFNKNGSDGYVGYPYSTTASTGDIFYGFCLDPSLIEPTAVNYNWVRELNFDASTYGEFDKNVYKTYQYYVNNLIYSGINDDNRNQWLSYSASVLRTYAFVNNVAVENSKTLGSKKFLEYRDTLSKYISGKIGTVGTDFDFEYFANSSDLESLYFYFYQIENNGLLWENPLEITPSVEFKEDVYTFKFEISFDNGTYQYFGGNWDKNIGYGYADFGYELKINNGAYSIEGNTLSGTSGGGCRSAYNTNCDTNNPNDPLVVQLEMSKTTYDAIKKEKGYVNVSLVYNTYHPMSSDNIFLNYYNNRESNDSENASYQRMIVFGAHRKNGVVNSDGTSSENDTSPTYECVQNGNDFYYKGEKVTINEYRNNCLCSNISSSDITNEEIKNEYDLMCGLTENHEYTSTLNNCTLESDIGVNDVSHKYDKQINTYCKLSCDERINIKNFTDSSLSVKAGQYFELDNPILSANKSCNVSIDYSRWYTNYKNQVNNQVTNLNNFLKYTAVNNPSIGSETCTNSKGEYTGTETIYYYSYTPYVYDIYNDVISSASTVSSGSWGGCDYKLKPDTDSDALSKFNTNVSNIESLLNDLDNCSKYLHNMGTDSQFYDFKVGLRFYYYQDYSKFGRKRNDNKPQNPLDDSEFNTNKTNTTSEGNYSNYNTNYGTYSYFDASKVKTSKTVGNANNLSRAVSYTYEFTPKIKKYLDVFTMYIKDSSNLENPVLLGYVYDTDVTAIEKDDNLNYYEFTALGDRDEIYNHFKTGGLYKVNSFDTEEKIGGLENLKRYCTYKINNDIFCVGEQCNQCEGEHCVECEGEECPETENECEYGNCDIKLNAVYRSVDPNDIDPNDRSDDDNKGFENWKDTKGQTVMEKIQADAEGNNTYNPNNLEYSFVLDSKTLKAIRDYNTDKTYNDFLLECNTNEEGDNSVEGNECRSDFIENAYKGTGDIGIQFGYSNTENNDILGREKWKYMKYSEATGKWNIENYETGEMTNTLFDSLKTQLGGITP